MEKIQETIQKLQQENERLRQELLSLKERLQVKQEKQAKFFIDEPFPQLPSLPMRNLTNEEIHRYGRQLILKDIGIQGMVSNLHHQIFPFFCFYHLFKCIFFRSKETSSNISDTSGSWRSLCICCFLFGWSWCWYHLCIQLSKLTPFLLFLSLISC
jgi:hypothetical protein